MGSKLAYFTTKDGDECISLRVYKIAIFRCHYSDVFVFLPMKFIMFACQIQCLLLSDLPNCLLVQSHCSPCFC